jgi:antitoxin HicB
MKEKLDHYMSLPYTFELQHVPEEGWFVRVKELRGCMSQGDTAEEAMAMIQEAMALWLEVSLEDGLPIPEPRPEDDYSGKFVVRVPRSLHRELVENAEQEGVSLNQYVNVALAHSVGRPTATVPVEAKEPCWSMLKSGVRRALFAAGLDEEAGELDEQLFADHVANFLAQVESALEGGYYRDAKWALGQLAYALYPAAPKSPVLAQFYRIVNFLCDQVEPIARRQQGIVDEVMLHSRITQAVQGSALARETTREAKITYSTVSMEPSLISGKGTEAELESVEALLTGRARESEWSPKGESRK